MVKNGLYLLFINIPVFLYYVIALLLLVWLIVEFIIWRLRILQKRKLEMMGMQIQYAKLEDKALRAQMNPHFIFNSLNSIKLLVMEQNNDQAVQYLTTFTKLLRGLLNNSDKSTITLHEELETCRLYLALESLRFNEGFTYSIFVEPGIDLKSVDVPPLLLQPLIENAIWHGLLPKPGERNLKINVTSQQDWICFEVEDDGIGRKASMIKNREREHISKGMELAKNRLHLKDSLNATDTKLIITDKYGKDGEPQGTHVKVLFDINN